MCDANRSGPPGRTRRGERNTLNPAAPVLTRSTALRSGRGLRLLRTATAALLAASLATGCALLDRNETDNAAAPEETLVPVLRLEVVAPGALKDLLEEYLDIGRLQRTPADQRPSDLEIARLVGSVPTQARELLQTEGYFEPQVTVTHSGLAPVTASVSAEVPMEAPPLPSPTAEGATAPARADTAAPEIRPMTAGEAKAAADRSQAAAEQASDASGGGSDAQARSPEGGASAPAASGDRAAASSAPSATAATAATATSVPSTPSAASAAGAAARRIPVVRVVVQPGPQVRIGELTVRAEGPVAQAAEYGDAAATAVVAGLPGAPGLQPGRPFRNPDWSESKRQVAARLRAAGYASATITASRAEVRVEDQRADLAITARSGPLYKAGEIRVRGLKLQDNETPLNLADFGPGAPLTEERLLAYQDRLQKAGLYQSASVTFKPEPIQAEATPVDVRLTELPLQQATVGVGISANTGPRTTLDYTHRRPFNRRLVARNALEWGRDLQSWTGDFQSHPGPDFRRNLLGVQVTRELSDTDIVLSQRFRVGRSQDTPDIERLYFLELLRSRKSELDPAAIEPVTSATALTINGHGVWRHLDDPLMPTRGYVAALQLGAGQARSRTGETGPIAKLYTRLVGYVPLGKTWFGQVRVEAGEIFKRDAVLIPDALGFRAGGDESVRGYAYRSLAPLDATGQLASGTKLLTASVELARPITPSMPSLLGAVFLDAGRAVNRWQDYDAALGYGVGVRWRSPVGPLKVDLAWGDEERKLRLHFSVGIAF